MAQPSMQSRPKAAKPGPCGSAPSACRPTPSNLPYIGRSGIRNLFLNTGHGTLGWTLACGSGKILADLVSGRQPEI